MMLQLDSYSRNKRPVADFVSRNRKAAKTVKSKSSVQTAAPKQRAAPQPPASRPSKNLSTERSSNNEGKSVAASETVVISKDYLDSLLKMNASKAFKEGGDIDKRFEAPGDPRSRHTIASPTNVPGLQAMANESKWAGKRYGQTKEPNPTSDVHHKEPSGPSGEKTSKGRAKAASVPVVEEYFPFGRPGCGAPLRTASGHVMADLRTVQKSQHFHTNDTNTPSLREPPQLRTIVEAVDSDLAASTLSGVDAVSPRFARGVGPHVDQYMLREIADKRKKELEHKSFLKEQMEAKQRAKREAKEKVEREEREEEARLAADRHKQVQEYRKDMERAAKKEEESRRRQKSLQEAIEKAAQDAAHVKHTHKSVARRHGRYIHDIPSHHSVTFDLPQATELGYRQSSPPLSGDTPPHPPTRTSYRQQQGQTGGKRRGSRIPVPSRAVAKGGNNRRTLPARKYSPSGPVKKHGHHHHHNSSSSNTVADYRHSGSNSNPVSEAHSSRTANHEAAVVTRHASPPVPALARRIKKQQQESEGSPERSQQHWGRTNEGGYPGDGRRGDNNHNGNGRHGNGEWERQDIPLNSTFVRREASQGVTPSHVAKYRSVMTSSPPVPAASTRVKTESTLPSIVSPQHSSQTRAQAHTNSTDGGISLPSLVSKSKCSTNVARPSDREKSMQQHSRQQAILQQLSQLRSGLLSHYSQVEVKLDALLNKTTHT